MNRSCNAQIVDDFKKFCRASARWMDLLQELGTLGIITVRYVRIISIGKKCCNSFMTA